MQKVVLFDKISEVAKHMEADILQYVGESNIESFESFEGFNLLAFDWYDIHSERKEISRVLIYMDKEDLFFICRDDIAYNHFSKVVEALTEENSGSNEHILCHFFIRLFHGDMDYLDKFEADINESVTNLLSGKLDDATAEIILKRQELLRLKRYYEQIDAVFDEIKLADNGLISPKALKRLTILGARTDRYLNKVCGLQELVSQMQETYQAQLSIQQNDLMKVFTVVTVIFMPLTLLVGWYGMNFVYMPEFHWRLAYPIIIIASIAIVTGLVWYFKRKKWL